MTVCANLTVQFAITGLILECFSAWGNGGGGLGNGVAGPQITVVYVLSLFCPGQKGNQKETHVGFDKLNYTDAFDRKGA